jgi:hypothetical protein
LILTTAAMLNHRRTRANGRAEARPYRSIEPNDLSAR